MHLLLTTAARKQTSGTSIATWQVSTQLMTMAMKSRCISCIVHQLSVQDVAYLAWVVCWVVSDATSSGQVNSSFPGGCSLIPIYPLLLLYLQEKQSGCCLPGLGGLLRWQWRYQQRPSQQLSCQPALLHYVFLLPHEKKEMINREKAAAVRNALHFLLFLMWLKKQSAQQDRLDPHQQAWMHRWMEFERRYNTGHEATAGIVAYTYWQSPIWLHPLSLDGQGHS